MAFLEGPNNHDVVVQAALRFDISQPAITASVVGLASSPEIDQAVVAVTAFQP